MPDSHIIVAPEQNVSLVLASASPRRSELLARTGLEFTIMPAEIDEQRNIGEYAPDYAARMAREKAEEIAAKLPGTSHPEDITPAVLAADTIVVRHDKIFGKPVNESDAIDTWRQLSGDTHEVLTALALCSNGQLYEEMSSSRVVFREISEHEMRSYWASGEPRDKAGGYAIQGLGSAWVRRLEGSYTGVVGLPMFELNRLLARIGVYWL